MLVHQEHLVRGLSAQIHMTSSSRRERFEATACTSRNLSSLFSRADLPQIWWMVRIGEFELPKKDCFIVTMRPLLGVHIDNRKFQTTVSSRAELALP